MVEKIVTGLLGGNGDSTNNVIVDLMGFDGWPACFAMREVASGPTKGSLFGVWSSMFGLQCSMFGSVAKFKTC